MVKADTEVTAWSKAEKAFGSKRNSEYLDPCQEAATRSWKCLHRNNGDRDMCSDYFQAYRDCKKQWTTERKAAKRKAGELVF